MDRLPSGDPREIGFNDSVLVQGRSLHVQTEVLGREQLVIRTTVLEGGVVRVAERQLCRADATGPEQLRALAEEQHRRNVLQLTEVASNGAR
jgi:hypothetical protein